MEANVPLKMKHEIARMRPVCRAVAAVLEELQHRIEPGITTRSIEEFCSRKLSSLGVEPATGSVGNFPGKICVSVNHVAAHGIPGELILNENDILTVDIAGKMNGWHGDSAWTYISGQGTPEVRRLLKAAWNATIAGIRAAKAGGRLGDIGEAIEKTAAKYGCSIIANCVGHGIGRDLHEEPAVLPRGEKGTDRPIVPGMVFTVEPVVTLGTGDITDVKNGHEIHTADFSLSAQYEHTIAVFSDRTEILTQTGMNGSKYLDFPPFF